MVGAVGGEQILNMGDGCQYVGLVLHEFGHAIGYYHEHNRPDRDNTVEIMWDNIVYGELGNKSTCYFTLSRHPWLEQSLRLQVSVMYFATKNTER